jgi:hypothetical protein
LDSAGARRAISGENETAGSEFVVREKAILSFRFTREQENQILAFGDEVRF